MPSGSLFTDACVNPNEAPFLDQGTSFIDTFALVKTMGLLALGPIDG